MHKQVYNRLEILALTGLVKTCQSLLSDIPDVFEDRDHSITRFSQFEKCYLTLIILKCLKRLIKSAKRLIKSVKRLVRRNVS